MGLPILMLRRCVAVLLSLCLIAVAPGPRAYAGVRAARGEATSKVRPIVTASPSLFSVPSLSVPSVSVPSLSAPSVKSVSIVGSPSLIPAPAAQLPSVAARAAGPKAQAVAASPSAAGPRLLDRVSAELPDFAAQGDASRETAGADFMRRVGAETDGEVAGFAQPGAEISGRSSGLAKASARPQKRAAAVGLRAKLAAARLGLAGTLFGGGLLSGLLSGNRIHDLLLLLPLVIVSLIFHEMAHARVAYKLGDSGPTSQDRGSFSLRGFMTHIDPLMTLLLPTVTFLATGLFFGMARPVDVNAERFRDPIKDNAWTAAAGPAANAILAGVGALAFAAFGALGLPALAGGAALFTMINVSLAVFNLIPFFPLDGHHILNAFLPHEKADRLMDFYETAGPLAWMPLVVVVIVLSQFGVMAAIVGFLSSLLLGVFQGGAASLAFSALPALGAAGFLFALRAAGPPALTPAAPAPVEKRDAQQPVEYVVMLKAGAQPLATDAHLSFVDVGRRAGVRQYASMEQSMRNDLQAADERLSQLASYGASPIATYKRINATTLRVNVESAPKLKAWLESLGHAVYDNSERRIIEPIPVDPESVDPNLGPVSMDENLRVTQTEAVHAVARARWGAPDMGLVGRFASWLTRLVIPQPLVGVIDTGADTSHRLLKRVKETKNATSGPNVDDNGHGTWVTSMVLNYAPWLKSVTHYKTFVNGGATLDDILKALTMAGNDGNLVISNSWGSDAGNPNSPDSKLVAKLAQEGHIMVFAAGNAGPRANTVGSPAIVHYKDVKTGALRVLSVAAADRDKKIASFSSRGPGSRMTKSTPDYPHRPDLTGVGFNTDGAWLNGGMKAISGTSMSTPSIAGAIALLAMMFGVTAKGEKLDAVVNAVMATLQKSGQGPDNEGQGFLNVEAAYKALEATLTPIAPNFIARLTLKALGRQ